MKSIYEGMTNTEIIKVAYKALKQNESYWMANTTYANYYQLVRECVERKKKHSENTCAYIADGAKFLMRANKKVFG